VGGSNKVPSFHEELQDSTFFIKCLFHSTCGPSWTSFEIELLFGTRKLIIIEGRKIVELEVEANKLLKVIWGYQGFRLNPHVRLHCSTWYIVIPSDDRDWTKSDDNDDQDQVLILLVGSSPGIVASPLRPRS